ncbi:hypothetical protein BBJ28_00025664, partial [Nothophytophthora sp. Chile5]
MYFQLIGLIMERVEFHLPVNGSETEAPEAKKSSTPKVAQPAATAGMGWLANSPTTSINAMDFSEDSRSNSGSSPRSNTENTNGSNNYSNAANNSDDGVDGERDLYLYRCLLIATFKYVVENLEAARLKRRSYVSLVETQFYARVLAVCFFRVPVLQTAMLDQIFRAYREKKWINLQAHDSRVEDPASGTAATDSTKSSERRQSTSRPWNGNTFAGSLLRWMDYDGYILSEEGDDNGSAATKSYEASRYKYDRPAASAAGTASSLRSDEEEFVAQNPTLFRWTRFSPYLGPYTDADIFRMSDSTRACWLEKLSHNGEFFSKFMGFVCLH